MSTLLMKPIPGFPRYCATSSGEIFDLRNPAQPMAVKQFTHPKGYRQVRVANDGGIFSQQLAHRLICGAFHPNPEGKPVVGHLNSIKTDNRPENLIWATHSENLRHDRSKAVARIHSETGAVLATYAALRDVSQDGFWPSAVSVAANNPARTAHGTHWRFILTGVEMQTETA